MSKTSDADAATQPDEEGDDYATNPRVAVDVLQRDQQAVLFDGEPDRNPPISAVRDGFSTYRAALNWWQATVVRTFGHLDDVFPAPQLARDAALKRALLADAPTDEQAHVRDRVTERTMRACSLAYRDLESRANEWLPGEGDTDWRQINPSEQRHIAMRPAFSRLDAEQAKTLSRLWGGFENRVAVERWVHSLPTAAEFDPILQGEGDIISEFARDDYARRMLTTDGEEPQAWRERFAATVLLPAMGVRAAKLQAGERPSGSREANPWNEVRD